MPDAEDLTKYKIKVTNSGIDLSKMSEKNDFNIS